MDGGGGYTSRGGLTARPRQDHVQISIDKFDSEAQISGLRGDVAKLKQMALAIEDETKQTGTAMEGLEEAMERAKLKLGQAMRRLSIAYKQSRSNLMLYVVLFMVCICLLVFVLNKLRRLGKLVFWR
ncbi:Qc-snare protein, SFT1 family [Scenedesmus sp. NREL 46B-D3]|nr:Qc-snare protein, SFT1 family [Scenedesmus sp. NREL 46B-D3]